MQHDPLNPFQPPPIPVVPATPAPSQGKVMAVLSYFFNFFSLPFFIVPLTMADSRLGVYHARQCLGLWLFALAGGLGLGLFAIVLTLITCGVGGILVIPLSIAFTILLLVLNIQGLIAALGERQEPLWLIGRSVDRWLASIQPKPTAGE